MKKRRILREDVSGKWSKLYEQIPYIPIVEYVRKKTSPIASIAFFFGGLLLFIAVIIQVIVWLGTRIPLPLPLLIFVELVTWVPVMFAAGLVLAIIGIIIDPTAGKIATTILLALIYAAFVLGWVDVILGWLQNV